MMVNDEAWLHHEYIKPKIEILPFTLEGIICESPGDGESEDERMLEIISIVRESGFVQSLSRDTSNTTGGKTQ